MKRFLGLTVLLMCTAAWWVANELNSSLQVPENGSVIIVEPGTSMIALAAELGADQVLRSPSLWQWYARITGKAESIRAGEYELTAEMTTLTLLDRLIEGRVKYYGLTILEGWTTADLLLALRRNPYVTQTLPGDVPVWSLLPDLGTRLDLPYPHGEGLFYPDTYLFSRGTTDVALLQQAAAVQLRELTDAWARRAPDPLLETPYDLLILASIIERETAVDAERDQIAGVFMRRLQRRMRLQTDPTVIYGLGAEYNGNLTRVHLNTDTPYNTYTRRGLPPTPISLPARASLRAAGLPAAGKALFFVAVGDGSGLHRFSETLSEHNQAVAAYLKQLRLQ